MQAAGGHAHASSGACREAHRTPGASSAAMVKMARSRFAMRMSVFLEAQRRIVADFARSAHKWWRAVVEGRNFLLGLDP